MKKLVGGFLLVGLMACSYSRQEVDEEREEHNAKVEESEAEKCRRISGVYSGPFLVGNKEYEIAVHITCPTDGNGNLYYRARIIRTDMFVRDISLTGKYNPTNGSLRFGRTPPDSSKNPMLAYEVTSLGATIDSAGRMSGSIEDSLTKVGTFENIERGSALPENWNEGDKYCHPFFDKYRERAYELSGRYEALINSDPAVAPPFRVALAIKPSTKEEGAFSVQHDSSVEDHDAGLIADFIPYLSGGMFKFYKGDKTYHFELKRDQNGDFYGTYRTMVGAREFDAIFVKTRNYSPIGKPACRN
jgi:hypothetical protein